MFIGQTTSLSSPIKVMFQYQNLLYQLQLLLMFQYQLSYCCAIVFANNCLGNCEGNKVDKLDGFGVGTNVGAPGVAVGKADGICDGLLVGDELGIIVGIALGNCEGDTAGKLDGFGVGTNVEAQSFQFCTNISTKLQIFLLIQLQFQRLYNQHHNHVLMLCGKMV
jgi:hypothetical protein